MRCSSWQLKLLAVVLLAACAPAWAEKLKFEALGPEHQGCGCSLVAGPVFSNTDLVLFQDVGESAPAIVRFQGKEISLKPAPGQQFGEWGSKVGDPVAAAFSGQGYDVRFKGKVVRTCYEQESCEAVWYEGVLRASSATENGSMKVTGACGC